MKKERRKETARPLSLLMYVALITVFLIFRADIAAAVEAAETTETTETTTTVDTVEAGAEESFFDNPAQAAHAAQMADKAAGSDPSVKEALSDVEAAQEAVDNATTPEEKLAAEADLALAEAAYRDALAEAAGTRSDEIAAMRADGMGWGEIAHELGVHPGVLGLGHTKGKRNRAGTGDEVSVETITAAELAEATARNTKTGNAKGHGLGLQSAAHAPGTGLDGTALASSTKSKSENSHSGNVAGAIGLGGGKGGSSSSAGGQGSGSGSSSGGGSGGSGSSGGSGGSGQGGGSGGGNDGGGHGGGHGGGNGGGGGGRK